MERRWTGNARRLRHADRAQIERLIWGGETFATAAAAVGCSTKSIQRFLALIEIATVFRSSRLFPGLE
jgi:hypothetical protein